jgi:small-conductance mechanosensitive channel
MISDSEMSKGHIKQIHSLQKQLGVKDRLMSDLLKENRELLNRAQLSEQALAPVQKSLNALTAEKSKWLRKCRCNQ